MSQSLTTKLVGLYTYSNDLSAVPEGALSQADNIIIDRDSEAEPRRGFDYLTHNSGVQSQFSASTSRAQKLFFYQNQDLCHYYDASAAPAPAYYFGYHDATAGWTNYSGTFNPPSSIVPMRSAQANENLYVTTALGVQKLDKYNGTPVAIGAPQALDVTTTVAASVTPTATTSSSVNPKILTSVSSVAGIAIGMAASGTGIPSNSYVVSFNGTTVTLNNAATASNSGVTVTFAVPGSAGWLATGSGANTTAYRVLWGIKDANTNLILGAPSQISQLTNTTAALAAPIVNFSIPSGVTTAHFYQIYRSPAVGVGITPNDEGQLVYEGNPVAADITYGTISVLDIVPDALRGATIYTAQSQEGLANENAPPPLANDLAVFRGCLFFGNTSGLQNFNLTLLGTGSPTGIQANDTITIDGIVYTADTAENTATGHFLVTTAFTSSGVTATTNSTTSLTSVSPTTGIAAGQLIQGAGIPAGTYVVSIVSTTVTMSQAATASASSVSVTFTGDLAAQAIRDTALSLVRVINRYASSTVYAYYLSGPSDLPGQILLQRKTVGAASFTLVSSRSTCWSPALTASAPGVTQTSTNDVNKNKVFWSKQNEPEAVPLGNSDLVGSGDKAILRIIALRDSLFILKEDGIFRLFGTDPTTFQVTPLDYTAILIAPESAVSINNQIFALTTQGVVSIDETGTKIMSRPIESDIKSLTTLVDGSGNSVYSTFQQTTFGVAYESDRAYFLHVMTNGVDTVPTQYYRFNTITQAWTRGVMSKTCGAVNPADDKLYLGNALMNIVDKERKSLTYSDYADYASTQTISNVTGTVVTISASDTIAVGAIIFQSSTVFGFVQSVDPIAGTVTMTLPTPFTNAAADVLAPISCGITWVPITLANPGMSKQLHEVTLLFKSYFIGSAEVGFASNISPGTSLEVIQGGAIGLWGFFAWGGTAETTGGADWGGDPARKPARVAVPRNNQRSSDLIVSFSHAYGFSPWILQGLSVIGNAVSERTAN